MFIRMSLMASSQEDPPSTTLPEWAEPAARSPRKQRTYDALLKAALRLMKEGRSFTGLSLREVTREAGVVPTAFYRHFGGMDELGLALVEEGGVMFGACCAMHAAVISELATCCATRSWSISATSRTTA